MKNKFLKITGVIFFSIFLCNISIAQDNDKEKVEWMTIEEAMEKSKTTPKKVFIDVYTNWCGWCKKMDANTFQNPVIAKYLNEHYYAVKLNAEQKEDIEFGDRTFKFIPNGRRGYHEFAAALLQGSMSYPTVVVLDEQFKMIQPLKGYREPNGLHPILQFFVEGQEATSWENFLETYESPFESSESEDGE